MANFCGKCGSKLDENTGLCANCNPNIDSVKSPKGKKQAKKERRKAQLAAMSFGQKVQRFLLKFLLTLSLLFILAIGTTIALTYFNIIDFPAVNDILISSGLKKVTTEPIQDNPDNEEADSLTYEVTPPDADSFYEDNSTIVSEKNVLDSDTVLTESKAFITLEERGFSEYPITTEYSMDGEYSEATEISTSSSTKHPIYQTYYISPNEELWTIIVIDNVVMANPVSYNAQSNLDVQVIISESDVVMSYDSTTNKFYETIPSESSLIVKTIDRIDAETLDGLTIGAIDGL